MANDEKEVKERAIAVMRSALERVRSGEVRQPYGKIVADMFAAEIIPHDMTIMLYLIASILSEHR